MKTLLYNIFKNSFFTTLLYQCPLHICRLVFLVIATFLEISFLQNNFGTSACLSLQKHNPPQMFLSGSEPKDINVIIMKEVLNKHICQSGCAFHLDFTESNDRVPLNKTAMGPQPLIWTSGWCYSLLSCFKSQVCP